MDICSAVSVIWHKALNDTLGPEGAEDSLRRSEAILWPSSHMTLLSRSADMSTGAG